MGAGSARRIREVPAPLAPIRGPELWPDRLARAGAGPAALQQPRSGTPAAARPPLVSQPALSRPARRRPSPPARGPLVNPCPPACPLIGGGGAPGHGDPPPHRPRLLPHCRLFPLPTPPGPPPASPPCKSREETRGFTSVFTPITTNPDRTDPD